MFISNCIQLYFEYTEAGGSTKCCHATIMFLQIIFCRAALSTQKQELALKTLKDAQLTYPICVDENPFFIIVQICSNSTRYMLSYLQ